MIINFEYILKETKRNTKAKASMMFPKENHLTNRQLSLALKISKTVTRNYSINFWPLQMSGTLQHIREGVHLCGSKERYQIHATN